MKKLMLIVNPASGKGLAKKVLGNIVEVFRRKDYYSCVFLTSDRGQAYEFAHRYGADYDLLVCVGGDGTFSDVINGIIQVEKERRPVIGYIPTGTANDIASTFKLSKTPEVAAETAVSGEPIPMDIGKMDDGTFSYIAAFGAFTDVSYSTPQNTKNILGHLAYIIEGISRISSIKAHHIVVAHAGGVIEDNFIFGCVMNTLSVGGLLKLDPDIVGLSDGYFEILLIKEPKNVLDYKSILAAMTSHNFDNKNIVFLHSKNVRFTFDEPVAWTRDGENGGEHSDISFENLNCAIQIMVPNGGN